MSLVYYYAPQSSASPVTWTLEELGIPHERVLVDIKAGQQREPAFLKLNPNGKVPLLVHEGVAIFESVAIQIYLGETFGVEKGLYPAPGPQRGEVLKWLVWTNVTLAEALSRLGRNAKDWAPEDQRNAKAGEQARLDMEALLKLVDEALAERPHLAGESFTLADLHLASWVEYVQMFGVELQKWPKLHAWLQRCTSRPAHDRAP